MEKNKSISASQNSHTEQQGASSVSQSKPLFIAGIGASAGGLEPLETFFENVAPDSGIAYVVVQHLSPEFESLMGDLLARKTALPIHRAENGKRIRPNEIYLISPKKDMTVEDGRLVLIDRDKSGAVHHPIDTFFRSLASNVGSNAIAVVLSGSGTDGSRSLVNVTEAGGLTVVQDPATAKFDGMPKSAIQTGFVDWVLSPDKIPAALLRYTLDPVNNRNLEDVPVEPTSIDELTKIVRVLRDRFKLDFTYYKLATIKRRIERRILIGRFGSMEEYSAKVKSDAREQEQLFQDLLICVTDFFRDNEAYDSLQKLAIDKIIQEKADNEPIRVWVAGCGTGEEAYSLAMMIRERSEIIGRNPTVKIFATDIFQPSLEIASQGRYSSDVLGTISPERRDRFFSQNEGVYTIANDIRQNIVFSQHNLIEDAPFTRVDLLSCRNLLIYLEPDTQRKVLSLFHFSLRVGGFLFLGASETLGPIAPEFDVIDGHWKIFSKRRHVQFPNIERMSAGLHSSPSRNLVPQIRGIKAPNLIHAYDALLDDVVPAGVLTDREGQVLHVFGNMDDYFGPRGGRPTTMLAAMIRPELKLAVNAALQRNNSSDSLEALGPFTLEIDHEMVPVTISCKSLSGRADFEKDAFKFFKIERVKTESIPKQDDADSPRLTHINLDNVAQDRIRTLETELQQTREHLQSVIEELETSNEELQSTNEELVSSNEELQSTNEELHSVNEELYTVNAEYQQKIVELSQLTNDINNLISSTDIGLVFLDNELTIRRFTPAIKGTFNLRDTDVGRPIDEISANLVDVDVLEDIKRVREEAREVERQVSTKENTPYLMRVRPYRDEHQNYAGIVITFINLTQVRAAEIALRKSEQRFRAMFEQSPNALIMVDREGRIVLGNSKATAMFGFEDEEMTGLPVESLVPPDKALEHRYLRADYMKDPAARSMGLGRYLHAIRKDGSDFPVEIALNPVETPEGLVVMSAVVDITEKLRIEEEIKTAEARLSYAIQAGNIGLWDWDVESGHITVNDGFLGQLGLDSSTNWTSRKDWESYLHPEDRDKALQTIEDFFSGKSSEYRSTFRLRHRDGNYRWILSVGGWLKGTNGSSKQMVGAHIDITDRMEQQEALERYAHALEETNRELDEFSYVASHDLQEPLRKLISYSKLLKHDIEDSNTDEINTSIDVIKSSAERMRSLVQDLLALSRTGKAELRYRKTPLQDCIRDALEAASSALNESNAKVVVEDLPTVDCDRTLVTQLYQNLVSNALKFRSDDRPPEIRFTARQEGDKVVLGVQDNGVGIKKDYCDLVFAPFKRLQGRSRAEGTGIGLTICRKAVERHGGRIWVESEPGEGSHFRFTIGTPEGEPVDRNEEETTSNPPD